MLQEFRSFDVNRKSLDELVVLAAFGRQLSEEYEYREIDAPEWLGVQLKTLKREIRNRVADQLERRKRELDLRLESTKSTTEKKQEWLKERRAIDEKLKEIGA